MIHQIDSNMKKILGLRTVAYKVADINKAKEWYTKAFDQEPYFDEPFYVGFNIGGYELGLQPIEGDNNIVGNSVTTYWGVDDIEKAIQHMLDLGAAKNDEPLDVGGSVVVASVFDPWNNIIGLIYNPHFKIEE
jgi:predicted enzyme related to lactoylglutathione lyase